MTYFELFEIPVQLKVDTASLRKKFIELSKRYHPDHFANENEAAQAESLEKSAMLNRAWKTFQHPGETIKYVLQSKELMEEEEKYTLPPDFLMEVLEINEELMEPDLSNSSGQAKLIESRINELQSQIYEPVKKIVEDYQENTTTKEELLQVKEYYYKKKYLDRIHRQLAEMK